MSSRSASATLIGLVALCVAAPSSAQQGPIEVAFELALNLTRLPSKITKIRVVCELTSSAIIASVNVPGSRSLHRNAAMDFPVLQGEVVQAARVVVSLAPQELDDPSGKQASYECKLLGFDQSRQVWSPFNIGNEPAFVLTSTAVPITGTFVW